jgi:hypothetical protein
MKSGMFATAQALTRSCQLGGPVTIDFCDEQFNPNLAASCAQQAVSNNVAATFYYGGFGDSVASIVTAANIPYIPLNGIGSVELSSPLSFPLTVPTTSVLGQINAAATAGRKVICLAASNVPTFNFTVGIATAEAKGLGADIVSIPIPPTATDMTGYASQFAADHCDDFTALLGSGQAVAIIQAYRQLVPSMTTTLNVQSMVGLGTTPSRKALGNYGHGIVLVSTVWPMTDKTKPFYRQAKAQFKAAGQPSGYRDWYIGMLSWAGLHVVADALTAAKLPATAANIPKALMGSGVSQLFTKYGLPPTNYNVPAYPTNPNLAKLRIFSKYVALAQENSPTDITLLSPDWVGVLHKYKNFKLPISK